MGWYSKKEVKVLLVICRKYEAMTIFRIIKSIDKDAFLTQANVNGVYGQGFDEIKTTMKSASSTHIEPEVPVRPEGPYTPLPDDYFKENNHETI